MGTFSEQKLLVKTQMYSSGRVGPDTAVWVLAPPSSSWVTSSLVTDFTTSGPVMNRYDVSYKHKNGGEVQTGAHFLSVDGGGAHEQPRTLTMKVKSVRAGE